MKLTYKYRLYPNRCQINLIDSQLFEASKLYNSALEHRIWLYKSFGENISYRDQAKEIKQVRDEGHCRLTNFSACQGVLRKLDKTYKAFFGRVKKGQKAGFPRFKPAKTYDTLEYPSYGDGCKLNGKKVYLQGIGDINIRLHRPVEWTIKTVSITRKNGKYYILFVCEVQQKVLPQTNKIIGIDMGIESFAVTSDSDFIENPRYYKSSQDNLRVLQRSVSRKKKGSCSRKKSVWLLAKQHEKIANQRRDFLHKQSNKIIKNNNTICIEKLNIKGLSSGMLAKSVNDVSWGIFFKQLHYKAENAGRTIIEVNPNGTSQRCNKCGTVVKKDLSVRWHSCSVCGESCHRDINSALEILKLGISFDTLRRSKSSNLVSEAV